jgi:hypothetical protein
MPRKKKETLPTPLPVQVTADYAQFVTHDVRDVSENRFARLSEEIRNTNLLEYFPIIVKPADSKGKRHIVDGNLRFEVAKELKLPLHFIEGTDVTSADIARALGFMAKWTLMEYLYYWTAEDSAEHHKALLFMGKHGALTAVTAVQLLSGSVRRDIGIEDNCRQGKFHVTHAAWAEEVCTEVELILEHAENLEPTQALFRAFAILYANPDFSIASWRKKMASQATLFVPQRTMGDTFHMLRNAFNVGKTWEAQIPDKDFLRKGLLPVTLQAARLRPASGSSK